MSTTPRQQATAMEQAPPVRRQERTMGAFVVLAAVLLETLPVTAWLLLVSAVNGTPAAAPLPIWWIATIILIAWAVGAMLRAEPSDGPQREGTPVGVRLFIGAVWVLAVAASLLISPAASGGVGTAPVLGIMVLVAYLSWRGLLLGNRPLRQERLNVRFLWGLAAIVLAILTAGTLHGTARSITEGSLALLLEFDVFVALAGIALAHLMDTIQEHRERRLRARGDAGAALAVSRTWILTSLAVSAVVVLLALALSLLVSYDTVQGVASLLRPVWELILTVLGWLVRLLAFLLFLLFDPIVSWVRSLTHPLTPQSTPAPVRPPAKPRTETPLSVPDAWLAAGQWALYVIVAVAAVSLLVLVLRRVRELRKSQEFEEVREGLDASAILGNQLRALLDRLRRPVSTPAVPAEDLAAGSVRLLYREVLASASQMGLRRRTHETPDEYARRLQRDALGHAAAGTAPGAPAEADRALATLTEAYDEARYDEPPHEQVAPPAVAAAQASLLRWLRSYAPASGDSTERHGRRRRRWLRRGDA
jgi:hypothetical protein